MVQGPLVSSLGETEPYLQTPPGEHGEGRNLLPECNASRCHTALQHIDDSEVWSLVVIILNYIVLNMMIYFTKRQRVKWQKTSHFSILILFDQKMVDFER